MIQSGTIDKNNEVHKQHEIRDSIHLDFPTPGSYLFKVFYYIHNYNIFNTLIIYVIFIFINILFVNNF